MNTEKHTGEIRRMEEKLVRPLQFIIRRFHSSELPKHSLLINTDRKTCMYSPMGKSLSTYHLLHIAVFERIEINSEKLLSGYLFDKVANRILGKLSHAGYSLTKFVVQFYPKG